MARVGPSMWRCRGCIPNVLRRLNLSKSAFWVEGSARPGGSGRHSSASRPVSVSLRTIVSAWRDCPPPARRGSRRTMALWVAVSRETRRKMGDSRSLIEGLFAGGVRGSATLSARPAKWCSARIRRSGRRRQGLDKLDHRRGCGGTLRDVFHRHSVARGVGGRPPAKRGSGSTMARRRPGLDELDQRRGTVFHVKHIANGSCFT